MKVKIIKLLAVALMSALVALLIMPAAIFGGLGEGEGLYLTVTPGYCMETTTFNLASTNSEYAVEGNYGEFVVLQNGDPDDPICYTYLGSIEDVPWVEEVTGIVPKGTHIARFSIYTEGEPPERIAFIEVPFTITCRPSSKVIETKPVWIRDHEMTCYRVWINENNNFEFVFWWEYKNNNWVKIFDMEGNEVFSIDMEKGNAHFEADLPDGFYTVRTYHNGFEKPIQEFMIGKP